MRKTNTIGRSAMALAVLVSSAAAIAYEPGDWVVRAGYASVNPDDDSTALELNGSALPATSVGVDDNAQLGITASYMFAPHWGVEVLAATPFKHDITLKGVGAYVPGIADGTKLGSAEHLPPTISVQYYFADAASKWQPYVGVGINYTTFFNEEVSSDAEAALGADNLSLDDSVGLAFEIGMDWLVTDNWLINASVWRANIETDASVDTALGRVTSTVTIDPIVYMLALGYKF